MNLSFEKAEQYILDIPKFSGKSDFETTGKFLELIGDISLTIPTIHIAGTNGKGSVCAYLRSVFLKDGKNVGMFTSPHLVSIRERFAYNDRMISKEEFVHCFDKVMEKLEIFKKQDEYKDYHPSFFEFLFFMSMIWFEENRPNVVILETGLGGRLDATNTIKAPRVCTITEIGMDHMEYLGDTIAEIAAEKAGIIRPGVPVVYVDKPVSGEVIEAKAKECGCDIFSVSKEDYSILNYTSIGIDFLLNSRYHRNASLTVGTCADYQVENAITALYTVDAYKAVMLEDTPSFATCREGIKDMKWPGRMEKVLPNLVIDGAHNEDGIDAFLKAVKADGREKRALLYSAVSDKRVEMITDRIIESNLFESIYVAVLDSYRAANMERLEACFSKSKAAVKYFENVSAGLEAMLQNAGSDTICYSAGSLYLVGEIKRILE